MERKPGHDHAGSAALPASMELSDAAPPLMIRIDAAFGVVEWSGDPALYDLNLRRGMDARRELAFLVGLDTRRPLALPMLWIRGNRPIHCHLIPLNRDSEAQILVLDANVTDLADRKLRRQTEKVDILEYRLSQLEHELNDAKRDAARASELKSRFISSMSHEFRTPLTSVLGYCDLLEKQYGRDDRRFQGIRRSANHLLSLVENLLEHGRVVADRIEPVEEAVHLRRLFESIYMMFEPLAAQKELEFTISEQACEAVEILTDPVRLRQIIVNLISNALRYTDKGGVRVVWRQRNDRLRFTVTDTGPGIPKDKWEHIFQAFSSLEDEHTRARGLGLGLSISQHLAVVLGGEILLDSTPGEGSTFGADLRAPAAQPAVAAPGGVAEAEGQRRILVVEDDMDVREFLAVVLRDGGYATTLAMTGQQALDKLQGGGVDVLLTDFNLTDFSGDSFMRRVRATHPLLPMIAMSASNAEADRNLAFEAGCSAFLIKPFDLDTLLKELERSVGG